jgi:succinate dehydrogenase / fumarate reductase membrane anchor subunit
MVTASKGVVRRNVLTWFFQRVSGVALILLIAIHMWTLHYNHPDVPPNYSNLVMRLQTIGYIVLDFSLLALALFHGLNGVRNIVLDYTSNDKVIKRWGTGLIIVGIVFSLWGGAALVKIMTMA